MPGWKIAPRLLVIALLGLGLGACCTRSVCRVVRPARFGEAGGFMQVFPAAAQPEEFIVKLKATGAAGAVTSMAGLSAKASAGRFLLMKGARPPGAALQRQATTASTLAALRALPDVEYAHPNYRVQAFDQRPDDRCYTDGLQWSYALINLPKAWDKGTGSVAVRVAVVDTGLAAQNDDFDDDHLLPGRNFVERDLGASVVDRGSFHGTHVAGTIGITRTNNRSGMAGINWAVGVQPVRVLDDAGGGSLFDIIQGIRWAAGLSVEGVPLNPTPARVINLSLGGEFPCTDAPALQEAITAAFEAGSIVVAAAGNAARDAAGFSPASCDRVVVVAAAGPEGELAYYSNHGADVDVLAPGGDKGTEGDDRRGILSAVLDGFAFFQGTSMAAPHVSAVLALTAARHPTAGPQQIVDLVLGAVRPLQPGQCAKPCGRGMLDADVP